MMAGDVFRTAQTGRRLADAALVTGEQQSRDSLILGPHPGRRHRHRKLERRRPVEESSGAQPTVGDLLSTCRSQSEASLP